MIGMNRYRYGYSEFIADRIDNPGDVLVVDGAIGTGTAFGLGDFDDQR